MTLLVSQNHNSYHNNTNYHVINRSSRCLRARVRPLQPGSDTSAPSQNARYIPGSEARTGPPGPSHQNNFWPAPGWVAALLEREAGGDQLHTLSPRARVRRTGPGGTEGRLPHGSDPMRAHHTADNQLLAILECEHLAPTTSQQQQQPWLSQADGDRSGEASRSIVVLGNYITFKYFNIHYQTTYIWLRLLSEFISLKIDVIQQHYTYINFIF